MKSFSAPERPEYDPYDVRELQELGVQYDRTHYGLSDRDFKKRHRPLLDAERLFERSVLADQQGESELMPQLQNEFFRSGLVGALGSLGTAPGTLAPGSAGEANLATHLGQNIMGFQDRNRNNRNRSLIMAENLFPRRSFGLTGADAANVSIANTAGFNNWNQANWATEFQLGQANYNQGIQQGNADSAADAAQTGALVQGGAALAGAAVLALALCWVARAAFGEESVQWRLFRKWLIEHAPAWLFMGYARHGQRIAPYVANSAILRFATRSLMRLVI